MMHVNGFGRSVSGVVWLAAGMLTVVCGATLSTAHADEKSQPAKVEAKAAPEAGKSASHAGDHEHKGAEHPKEASHAKEAASHDSAKPHDAAPKGDAHGGEHGESHSQSPIDFRGDLALWSLVTFLIFLVVLTKLAWTPLISGLTSRENGILKNIHDAEEARVSAERSLAEYKSKLEKAEAEVSQLLTEARKAAEQTRQEMLAATERDAKAIKDRALSEIDRVRAQALQDIFSHMADLVTNATENVLGKSITDADHQRLVSEAIAQFSNKS